MTDTLRIEHTPSGLCVLTPFPARPGRTPSALDPDPDVDMSLLEVAGGHLTWSVLDAHEEPVAVLDQAAEAQQWVGALYGERAAVALATAAATGPGPALEVPLPTPSELASRARTLAYAHWAARWWPASTLDGIPPLDARVLRQDLERLTERCDALRGTQPSEPAWYETPLDRTGATWEVAAREAGAPAATTARTGPVTPQGGGLAGTGAPQGEGPGGAGAPDGGHRASGAGPGCTGTGGTGTGGAGPGRESWRRGALAADGAATGADACPRYALAAGATAPEPTPEGLLIAQGTAGTDWRRYPPGLVDASERAVTWRAIRTAGRTVVAVRVAAAPERTAPGVSRTIPPHLVPWAEIGGPPATTALTLTGDAWVAQLTAPDGQPTNALAVGVYLPGFDPIAPPHATARPCGPSGGPHCPEPSGPARARGRAVRERVRELVRERLARAAAHDVRPGLLAAERAAADLRIDR